MHPGGWAAKERRVQEGKSERKNCPERTARNRWEKQMLLTRALRRKVKREAVTMWWVGGISNGTTDHEMMDEGQSTTTSEPSLYLKWKA